MVIPDPIYHNEAVVEFRGSPHVKLDSRELL
jgi:hypothetical protein